MSDMVNKPNGRESCPIDVRPMPFQKPLRTSQRRKSELLVQRVCVRGCQQPAPQTLQLRMADNRLHQPLRQAMPAELFENKHIADPAKRSPIGRNPRKTRLAKSWPLPIDSKTQRVLDRPSNHLERNALGPIRTL